MNAHHERSLHRRAASEADEPAGPAPADAPTLAACPPHEAAPSLIEAALDAGRDVRPGRATRADGWTRERILIFLNTLARTGLVVDAVRASGMSERSAFALRNSAKGRAFALAWDAALLSAGPSLNETLASRAIHGWDEPVFRNGEICGYRRRFDNRLAMKLLYRHDRRASTDGREAAVRLVADELEQFFGIAADGGDGAADFLGHRLRLGQRCVHEADLFDRADNYVRCGAGLAREIDVSDLDSVERAHWTEEQTERARRSGLLDAPEAEQDPVGDGTDQGGSDEA